MYETPKMAVTIIRKWDNPEIQLHVNSMEIGVEMQLSDFMESVKKELSPSIKLMTDKAFSEKFDTAVIQVIDAMKKETIHIV